MNATTRAVRITLMLACGAGIVSAPRAQTPAQPDVIVVGAGISGLSAALEAAQGGVSVQVVDMWSVFGGHAVMSGGGVAIVGSALQTELGIEDSPQIATRDFFEWGRDPNPYWVDYYARRSKTEVGEWLESIGVRWTGVLPQFGNSVPRFHRPDGRGLGLVTPIYRQVLRYPNVTFRWNFRITALQVESGRVVGVRGEDLRTGEAATLRAGHVLLATGGFQSNLAMVRRFWPAHLAEPGSLLVGSGLNSEGSGHALAGAAGAVFHRMDHQWNYPWGLPHPHYPGEGRALASRNPPSIWVNTDGERFVNEHADTQSLLAAVVAQDRSTYWSIFDDDDNARFYVSGSGWDDRQRIRQEILDNPELTTQAASLAALAEAIGLDPLTLEATVARFNTLVDEGVDRDFGRFATADERSALARIDAPPFYAIQYFPMTRKSMGGVAVDADARVIREDGSAIPGLYAAGELTGFAGINGSAGLEGTFLGPAILTGRVAGSALLRAVGESRPLSPPTPAAYPQATPPADLSFDAAACDACHALAQTVEAARPGYGHFERVHRRVLSESQHCGTCHAELAPYAPATHAIDRFAQTANCVHCHLAVE